MANDNITLNPGSDGAAVRTLADSNNDEWPACVACYATTVSAGANVLAIVTPTAGLPVQPQTGATWAVTQSGSWAVTTDVTLAQGSTTSGQSGPLVQGACTVGAPTYVTNKTEPLSLDTSGNLRVLASQSGTWNVATVTTVTTVSAVTAITNALPAGTNLIGQMSVADQVAALFNGTTSLTVQYANFSTSSSGATTIVAAVSGKKIYVLRWSVSGNGNTNVNLQSHTTTTLATGVRYLTQYGSGGGAYCPAGIMATAASEALDVNNSNAIAISGEITYVQF